MTEKNVLDDIFGTPEEQVDTFVDVLREEKMVFDPEKDDINRITDGRPDKVKIPKDLKEQASGWIGIQHGWHDDDYVWHIAPLRDNRSWKVSIDRVVYAIAKILNVAIPDSVEVKIWMPYADWEIKEVTFKAVDPRSVWSFQEEDLEKATTNLFETLNSLV